MCVGNIKSESKIKVGNIACVENIESEGDIKVGNTVCMGNIKIRNIKCETTDRIEWV